MIRRSRCLVHLERAAGRADEAVILREAIHEFFAQRAAGSRRSLRQLFRRGRISLAIGLAFLASSIAIGDALGSLFSGRAAGRRFCGKVCSLEAGWRCGGLWKYFFTNGGRFEQEARLFDRLSAMPVEIVYTPDASSDAWRSDWPAVTAAMPR